MTVRVRVVIDRLVLSGATPGTETAVVSALERRLTILATADAARLRGTNPAAVPLARPRASRAVLRSPRELGEHAAQTVWSTLGVRR